MLPLDRLEGAWLRSAIVLTGAFCFTLLGYDQGVLGSIISLPLFLKTIDNANSTIQGLVVSIYDIGCMIGCLIAAVYGLSLGRRRSVIIGCLFIIIGGSVQAANYALAQIIIFRIITGIGTGIVSSTVPVWLSEVSMPKKRGQKVAIQLTMVLTGNVTAYWINYGLSSVKSDFMFRFPLALQCFYPAVALFLAYGLPESPRVLYYWGNHEEGDEVLRRLKGANSIDDNLVAERTNILEAIAFEEHGSTDQSILRMIFWDSSPVRNSYRVLIIVILQGLQQLGGCNVIAYYQTILFRESVGLNENLSRLVAGCSSLCFLVGTLPAIYLIENMGRRRTMLLGSFGCFLSMLALTILLAIGENNTAIGWGAAASIFLFQFIYGSSWASVVWVYSPEISPLRFRHINSSLGTMSQWAMTFLTVMMTPTAIANTGWKIYIFFVVFNFVQIPFVYFMCPETAGRTLEELDAIFANGKAHTTSSTFIIAQGGLTNDDEKYGNPSVGVKA